MGGRTAVAIPELGGPEKRIRESTLQDKTHKTRKAGNNQTNKGRNKQAEKLTTPYRKKEEIEKKDKKKEE